jgi:energy-coupling factor transporter ATP-binding protein EcfA2
MTRRKGPEEPQEPAYTCGLGGLWSALDWAGYQLSRDPHGTLYLAVEARNQLPWARVALDSKAAPLVVQQAVSAYAASGPHGLHPLAVVPHRVVRDAMPGLQALPEPRRRDGTLARFRALAPLAEGDCDLLLAWMAYSLCAPAQHLLLVLYGSEDSGKSTLARLARAVIDPHDGRLFALPEKLRDLVTVGASMRLLALDNLSMLDAAQSDLLCKRLDSGVSAAYKANYTDADMVRLFSEGPIVLTAVTSLIGHADLASRALFLPAALAEQAALAQSKVDQQLGRLLPGLFAAVLDAAAAGLAGAGTMPDVPEFRRRDFATFAQAAAPAFGRTPELMRALLGEHVRRQRGIVAQNAPAAAATRELPKPDGAPVWRGQSLTELLVQLVKANPAAVRDPAWPNTEAQFRFHLARERKVLASQGVTVREQRGKAELFLAAAPVSPADWTVGDVPDLEPPAGRLH